MEQVTLVDENDRVVGSEEKLRAHIEGKLHRAFSIFVFDAGGRILLQKRARTKYHSAGLWSNTCCGHPRPNESLRPAANRRLFEEMGFRCHLREAYKFRYRIALSNNLIEDEFDHVLVGTYNADPIPVPAEVESWKWLSLAGLREEIGANPEHFSYWLRLAITMEGWNRVERAFTAT